MRVLLRVAEAEAGADTASFSLDRRRRQVTLLDPAVARGKEIDIEDRKVGVAAPKMFAFDNVFTSEDSQAEVSISYCLRSRPIYPNVVR